MRAKTFIPSDGYCWRILKKIYMLTQFSKTLQYQIPWKYFKGSRICGRADGQTLSFAEANTRLKFTVLLYVDVTLWGLVDMFRGVLEGTTGSKFRVEVIRGGIIWYRNTRGRVKREAGLLIFCPEHVSSIFLRNFGKHLADNTACGHSRENRKSVIRSVMQLFVENEPNMLRTDVAGPDLTAISFCNMSVYQNFGRRNIF
jgi:hypothetical protein